MNDRRASKFLITSSTNLNSTIKIFLLFFIILKIKWVNINYLSVIKYHFVII